MALSKKTGICTICKRKGRTDWHHIISQHHAIRTGQKELLSDPNNVIELCRSCHDQTTASMVRKRLTREGKSISRNRVSQSKKIRSTKSKSRKIKNSKLESKKSIKSEKQLLEELRIDSLNKLSSRGVLDEIPLNKQLRNPYNYLLEYLKIISLDDSIAEKWNDYFSKNPSSRELLVKLYPKDHWLHDESIFDLVKSDEWENDGFCWLSNGDPWRKELSYERSQFEIKISKIHAQERAALENLQIIAVKSENSRRLKEKLEESIHQMNERGVYFADSPVVDFKGLHNYLNSISIFDDSALKWIEIFNQLGESPLSKLYPKDHWLHDSKIFEKEFSSDFEKEGFCWTPKGGAWKNNLSLKQCNAEINLAKIRSNERNLIEAEELRLSKEKAMKERIDFELECTNLMKERGVYLEESPVQDKSQLVTYIRGISDEDDIADKWSKYLDEHSSNIFSKIYPEDHWLYNEEDFDPVLSSEFEEDGFGWTSNGGVWKKGLSLKQAKAEIRLAKIKIQQKQVLQMEEKRLERMKEEK